MPMPKFAAAGLNRLMILLRIWLGCRLLAHARPLRWSKSGEGFYDRTFSQAPDL
jgi:hypothetical protein